MSWNTLARMCALPAAAGLIALAAAPAAGHVTISPTEGAAGSSTVLTASWGHGCDGSPTTRVAIQMPEEILGVVPTRHPMWEVRKVMEQLDEPVADSHGNEVTERVAQVVYTAQQPLPDGYRDAFELSLQLPDTPGETLTFPVVQTCEEGETAWVETAADGEADELEAPAPTVTVTEAADEGHGGGDEASDDASPAAATTDEGADEGAGPDALSIAALVAGLLGLAVGALALVTARKRT